MDRDFNRIVNSYSDMLLRICIHYTKNKTDAEDVVQNVFLKLLESNISFENYEHEKAWLIRVCINLCKDNLKSSWHKKVHSINDEEIKDGVFEIEEKSPILTYIRNLPSNQKIAIYLFYYEGIPVSEIASLMKSNQNTVLSWLRRGRKKLEKLLKEDF